MTKKTAKNFTLSELAKLTQAKLIGNEDHLIFNIESLEKASSEDASFLANPRYKDLLSKSNAGVICINFETSPIEGKNFLVSENPSLTFQKIAEAILELNFNASGFKGIHPTAVIHPEAEIGNDVQIGPYVVVDIGATIGSHTKLDSFVSIGPGVKVGSHCRFYSHVIVRERCLIGDRVILQPGAVIGSCGFGYVTNAEGKHLKLDQLGIVIIEDDVEIGANTTIDRARFKTTKISKGTKIDNLVQIGHNVIIGSDNIIVSQTGIAGSTKTGRHVIMGGQVGVVGHIEITDGVMIATRGGVSKSITKAGKYGGTPVIPLAEYNRHQVFLRRIDTYVKRIEELEKRLNDLEASKGFNPK